MGDTKLTYLKKEVAGTLTSKVSLTLSERRDRFNFLIGVRVSLGEISFGTVNSIVFSGENGAA